MSRKQMEARGWELVGYCGVDSGLIAIVDPCYVMVDDKYGPIDPLQMDYKEMCEKMDADNFHYRKDQNGVDEFIFSAPGGNGVITSNWFGDGNYPVYVKRNKEGQIIKVMIDFQG